MNDSNKLNGDIICAKIGGTNRKQYRKITTAPERIYPEFDPDSIDKNPYTCGALLDDGAFFFVNEMSRQPFAIDLLQRNYRSLDFVRLEKEEFGKIDFLFTERGRFWFFQNVTPSKIVMKKSAIRRIGDNYEFSEDCDELVINEQPDAIYDRSTDTLYFQRLEKITGIFRVNDSMSIGNLYREATQNETVRFLNESFIALKDGFTAEQVKTANRKRIAIASETLKTLKNSVNANGRNNLDCMIDYVGDYCPSLKAVDNKFEIGTDQDLKLLLYGLEQRFYTTTIGNNEKRIANSIIRLE